MKIAILDDYFDTLRTLPCFEYDLQFSDVFDQIIAYAAGAPTNVVNPGVLRRRTTP
jgi:hypothetical protein